MGGKAQCLTWPLRLLTSVPKALSVQRPHEGQEEGAGSQLPRLSNPGRPCPCLPITLASPEQVYLDMSRARPKARVEALRPTPFSSGFQLQVTLQKGLVSGHLDAQPLIATSLLPP